jgi:predicted DCC family thiol-disulfide oxidoreductase YuxK
MDALYVLYDETCGFCCRCAEWLTRQPAYVHLECLPAGDADTRERFPVARGEGKDELVAVDSNGGVYRDTDAFIVALWALREWREWSLRLSTDALKPMARRFFELGSGWRHGVSRLLGLTSDAEVRARLERIPEPGRCTEGACSPAQCEGCGLLIEPGRTLCSRCLVTALSGPR